MMREQTQLAEQGDFTTVWLTEHHFAHNGYLNAPPNPIMMSLDLASHSKKIRVGQAPIVLPDWHPLRVAEDIALLDNMTEGRVDFGVAKGINERVTLQFNKDADRRDNEKSYRLFMESLEVILKAWTEDPFTHKGEFYEFPVPGWKETNRFLMPLEKDYHSEDGEYTGMYIHPRPYQNPHPPVWLMSNSPHTYKLAAERGFNVIGMSSPPGKLVSCWDAFADAESLDGTIHLRGDGVGVCTVIYVAETMEQADKDVRNAINGYYEYLSGSRPEGSWTRKAYLDDDANPTDEDLNGEWFDFLMKYELIWVGDADYVAEKIQKYNESIGLKHIMLLQQFPGFDYQKILKSMTLFSERVMPRFNPDGV
jgi:alkanesulfonate monooxygenase SsuD/methylene tetrahydromethanopterin reductase-like flavin-dependent oxidoreductase (luciferase family)